MTSNDILLGFIWVIYGFAWGVLFGCIIEKRGDKGK